MAIDQERDEEIQRQVLELSSKLAARHRAAENDVSGRAG